MRIARILTRLNLGGPARQVLASDPILGRSGHDVRVFAGTPEQGEGDLFELLASRGIDLVRVPQLVRGIAPARDLVARRRLTKELEAFAPDVVHTHASKAGYLGRRAARGTGAAIVHTFHGHVLEGYFPAPISRRLIAQERKLALQTDRVIAVSHATAEDLLRLEVTTEDKLVVIQPGIELAPLLDLPRGDRRSRGVVRELVGASAADVVIGVVGRLAEVKRPELALAVFELLSARHPQLHLVFVGDGRVRGALERRIAALGENARAHMIGNRPDMVEVLADLDGLLATSRSEGMPVALIEAAAAGLPVVATPVGGVPELVVHERTGFLGTTPEELAFGLSQLLEQPEERRAMGERARLRIQRTHSAERLAGKLEELYRVVVEERGERA